MLWAVFRAKRHGAFLGSSWSMLLERGLGGACGRKEERRQGWVLCSFKSAQYTGVSPFGYVFAKLEYVQKAEAEQVVGHSKSRMRRLKRMLKLVPRYLSSRSWVPAGRFSQILPDWLCGLSQGLSTLTSPTTGSCPGRVLADGFESSDHPKEDPIIVCYDGLSYPRPVTSGPQKSKSIWRQARAHFILLLPLQE